MYKKLFTVQTFSKSGKAPNIHYSIVFLFFWRMELISISLCAQGQKKKGLAI